VNNVERIGGSVLLTLFAISFAFLAVTSGDFDSPFLLVGFTLSSLLSARGWRSSTVRCSGNVIIVTGLHRTLRVHGSDVKEWRVEERVVGAFRRATLSVLYMDGREKNLQNYGIWARLGGRMEASLRAAAADLPTATGPQRP
jgi:hypothetical protein